MSHVKIHLLQADIIFKALHYAAQCEGIEIPAKLTETYEVLAEDNPKDTHIEHAIEVMEYLNDFIRNSSEYSDSFMPEVED